MTTSRSDNREVIKSALLGGFIAGFIWMAITVLVGSYSKSAIVGGGFGFLVGTIVVSVIVARTVRGRVHR